MTMYQCHCGSVHDSAVQGPCPTTVTFPIAPGHVRAVWMTELERWRIVDALLKQNPSPGDQLQWLIDRLLPTDAERKYGREFRE